jgi:hypothetical protein
VDAPRNPYGWRRRAEILTAIIEHSVGSGMAPGDLSDLATEARRELMRARELQRSAAGKRTLEVDYATLIRAMITLPR